MTKNGLCRPLGPKMRKKHLKKAVVSRKNAVFTALLNKKQRFLHARGDFRASPERSRMHFFEKISIVKCCVQIFRRFALLQFCEIRGKIYATYNKRRRARARVVSFVV